MAYFPPRPTSRRQATETTTVNKQHHAYRATVDAMVEWVEKVLTWARGRSALFFGFDLNDGLGLRYQGHQAYQTVTSDALGPHGHQ
eukprot:5137617-Pyramimonas_sp.AAC.1